MASRSSPTSFSAITGSGGGSFPAAGGDPAVATSPPRTTAAASLFRVIAHLRAGRGALPSRRARASPGALWERDRPGGVTGNGTDEGPRLRRGVSSERREGRPLSRSETEDEAVYDEYLAACAAGRPEDPAAVLARHPDLGAAVRTRIEELWRIRSRHAAAGGSRTLDRLGPYRLVERLDAGGMGTVHRAVREPDGAEVAVKVLRPELAASATALERLRREALALSRVRHPNVVRVLEFAQDGPTSYLVLELVPGRGLERIVAEAAARGELLPAERVVRWGAALARGLDAAHREGVVHRDVKPSNVHVRPDDAPMLLDFGIAQVPERTPGALTTTFAGSPFYAAPEQLTGEPVDGRTDVYGLCATLYQCLTGRVPFASDRFEEVMRRTLTEEPVPVRRLAPHVPRDVETVVLAGLEKDRARRPATAADLAEDLEAALRGARIRSRRPGIARSLGRRVRARPVAAAVAAVIVLGGVGVAVGSAAVGWAERARIREEAGEALREATARTDLYVADPERRVRLEVAVRDAESALTARWLPDDEVERLDAQARELRQVQRERDTEVLRIVSILDRAERLAPDLEGIAAARARLHLIRWREANAAGDATGAAFHRDMVERAEPGGTAAREVSSSAHLTVVPDPPDAEIHLFRVVLRDELLPGGGNRLVPVPWRGGVPELPPSPWALRVGRSAFGGLEGTHIVRVAGHWIESCVLVDGSRKPLQPLDRLVAIGGVAVHDVADARRLGADGPQRAFRFARGEETIEASATSLDALGARPIAPSDAARTGDVQVTLWRDGRLAEGRLPGPLELRVTAAPLLEGPLSRVAPEEASSLRLPPGEYLVLLRAKGRIDTRVPLRLAVPGAHTVSVRLPREDERPPGCVRVLSRDWEGGSGWIQEREVTAAEYLEFLNDPATRAAIDASAAPVLVPRHEVDPPLWPRGGDGAFRLPPGTESLHPVLGVSYEDAKAYAAWLSRRAAAAGEPWRYRLPRGGEWTSAGGSALLRRFPFGPTFRPRWAGSCFSRPYPAPEPVLSHPVDESPFGVFDLCGSAMEWCDDWYDEPRGLRRLCGGSWAQGWPDALAIWAPRGARPDRADREFGFRLVGERADAGGGR